MSKEELFSLWESTNNSPFPSARSKNSPLDSFYPITNYFVMLKNGKPVGGIGYGKKGKFTTYGGAFVIESERRKNIFKYLDRHLIANTNSPYIAGISSTSMSNETLAESYKKRNWIINPTDEELGNYVNDSTIKAFKDYYGNHPKGAKWAVKELPLEKWFNIIKSSISDEKWTLFAKNILTDVFPNTEELKKKYVKYSNAGKINQETIRYYLNMGRKIPKRRKRAYSGILEELLRGGTERYDIEDGN